MTTMTSAIAGPPPVGELLRDWRRRRRLSQLDLSIQTDISARHLSFVETGRSRPTPEMILRLTEQLDVPLRERNTLLLAGGYAPAYPEHGLDAPELDSVRTALRQVLAAHQPNPAVVINRWWELAGANDAVGLLTDGCAPWLLEPPVNVLRLSLHPDGVAPRIANLGEWRGHVLARLRRQVELTADPVLIDLLAEAKSLNARLPAAPPSRHLAQTEMVVPFRIRLGDQVLSFFTTTLVFGTPLEVSLSELAVESFFPADTETAATVRRLAGLTK
jgi:transcriptional regulator with XRE-family HTH domain